MEQAMTSGDKGDEGTRRDEYEDVLETWAPEVLAVRVLRANFDEFFHGIGCALILLIPILFLQGPTVLLAPLFLVPLFLRFWMCIDNWTIVVRNTSYQLTRSSLRLRCGSEIRELRLSQLTETAILPVRGHRDVGHIVLYEHGTRRGSPAIPLERPFVPKIEQSVVQKGDTRPEAIPVERPSVPKQAGNALGPQVHKGAMTFWLVANPELVRERILRAARGINPNASGPYR